MSRRYVNGHTVPRSVSRRRVLMHNHFLRTIDMPCGVKAPEAKP
jgi:hypothetical protein